MLPPIHGADLDPARARYGGRLDEWIDFSSSVNPYGFSPEQSQEILASIIPALPHYPDPSYQSLRGRLGSLHSLDARSIWPLNGSIQGIHAVAQMTAGRDALVPAPSFQEYAYACRLHGLRCDEIRAIPKDGLVILGYPNSPTGDIADRGGLLEIILQARDAGTIVLIDEAFLPFVENAHELTMIPDTTRFDNLIVLRSLTKTHALAGVRLGYAVACPNLIDQLRRLIPAWSVSQIAVGFGHAACEHDGMIAAQIADVRREAARFHSLLASIPDMTVRPSAANFFLCSGPVDALELKHRLSEKKMLIRTCADYPGLSANHFRVAVRRPKENDRLIAALRAL